MSAAAIQTQGLIKRYGEVVAVAGLDLEVLAGECLGLLGPNGAGKTTTIEILEGLTPVDGGTVRILGMEWGREAQRIREEIGVQLQETRFSDKLTVAETLRLFRSFYRRGKEISAVIDLVGLGEKRDARVGTLSGGQKQRLALGCALVNEPRVLFLDEPTTGLDPQARRLVWEVVLELKRQGATVLLTTHYMEEAERLADRVTIIDHGKKIAEGPPRQVVDSLGAGHIIRFATDDREEARLPAAELAGLPGVLGVRDEGPMTLLAVRDAETALPALLDLARRRGTACAQIETHRPTLEDVFVALTGRHLRDE